MHFWFEQIQEDESARLQANQLPNVTSLNPLRMLVRGVVEVDVPEVAARTDRMEIWFRRDAGLSSSAQKSQGFSAVAVSEGDTRERPSETKVAVGQKTRQPIPPIRPPVSVERKLLATGNLIRGLVVLASDQNELEEMSLEGRFNFSNRLKVEGK